MVIAEGPTAIFKISIALLKENKVELMKLDGFEQVADFVKNQMNNIENDTMKTVLSAAGQMDLGKNNNIHGILLKNVFGCLREH